MKKVLIIGKTGAGKTTLLQRLLQQPIRYRKTQSVEVHGHLIDTPGEYLENKRLFHAITVTCVDAEIAIIMQDATDADSTYFFGMNSVLNMPLIGVISKTDLADAKDITRARSFLKMAGAQAIVCVSSSSDDGLELLRQEIESLS